jgi:hypothetical protein
VASTCILASSHHHPYLLANQGRQTHPPSKSSSSYNLSPAPKLFFHDSAPRTHDTFPSLPSTSPIIRSDTSRTPILDCHSWRLRCCRFAIPTKHPSPTKSLSTNEPPIRVTLYRHARNTFPLAPQELTNSCPLHHITRNIKQAK